jgi:integrase
MPPKTIISTQNKEQRKLDRRKLGPLNECIVSPLTKKRYESAVAAFFSWMQSETISLPATVNEFDDILCSYLEFLWEEGEGRSLASNTVAGLQYVRPTLKKNLICAWRLLSAWAKRELPARAPPLTPYLLECFAGQALLQNEPLVCLVCILAFHGLLRTGEACRLKCQDLSFGDSPKTLVINLGLTKGGARIVIDKPFVVQLAEAFCLHREPHEPLMPKGVGYFRQVFNHIVTQLNLVDWGFKPYSLRRGGATEHFRRFNSLSATVVKGRWASSKMARVYLNDGLATLASYKFNSSQARLQKARNKFNACANLAL